MVTIKQLVPARREEVVMRDEGRQGGWKGGQLKRKRVGRGRKITFVTSCTGRSGVMPAPCGGRREGESGGRVGGRKPEGKRGDRERGREMSEREGKNTCA